MTPEAHVATLAAAGAGLAAAADGALDRPVPSCPGWDVAHLMWHTGSVHRFWQALVAGDVDRPEAYERGPRPAPERLIGWYRDGLDATVSTLAAADPDAEVWTWSDDHTARFVQRRMAQETVVHGWDGGAAIGAEPIIDAEVAVDGVEEFLGPFLAQVPVAVDLGAGVHLHATDADGEWLVRNADGAWQVERRHDKGVFAARGPAADLLLLLWGRRPPAALQTFGEAAVLDALLVDVRTAMAR